LQAVGLSAEIQNRFKDSVQVSLDQQARNDATEQGSFEDFVADYFA
jgi:hypothetical protein